MNIATNEGYSGARATKEGRSKMRDLAELAYATVLEALKLEYGAGEARSEKQRRQCRMRAHLSADYLFGREPDPDSRAVETLDLAREQEVARDWLNANARMRELVLESLRVLNLLNEDRQPRTGRVGEGLLMAYGQGSFRAPDLATYDALVHDAIYSLPLHAQQSIFYGLAKTQSCH